MKTIMRTISIEQCSNGYIVRPFNPGGWCQGELPAISVFNNMADMQAALPQFFEMPDPLVKSSCERHLEEMALKP